MHGKLLAPLILPLPLADSNLGLANIESGGGLNRPFFIYEE